MEESRLNPELSALPKCPVCSSEKRSSLFTIKMCNVKKCDECGLKYLDPCLSSAAMISAYESDQSLTQFHSLHEGYYDYGGVDEPSRTRTEFLEELKLVEDILGPRQNKTVFDIGYGNGFFLAAARSRQWQVDGIDTSRKNQELARQKFGLQLRCGSLDDLKPDPIGYDAISLLDVVEHLTDPHPMLQKAKSMLKHRGVVLIAVPNDRSLLVAVAGWINTVTFGKIKVGLEKMYLREHVCYYNLETLSRLLRMNGFALRRHFYSSTDLRKYSLPLIERCVGHVVLFFGRLFGLQNRLVAAFQIGENGAQG